MDTSRDCESRRSNRSTCADTWETRAVFCSTSCRSCLAWASDCDVATFCSFSSNLERSDSSVSTSSSNLSKQEPFHTDETERHMRLSGCTQTGKKQAGKHTHAAYIIECRPRHSARNEGISHQWRTSHTCQITAQKSSKDSSCTSERKDNLQVMRPSFYIGPECAVHMSLWVDQPRIRQPVFYKLRRAINTNTCYRAGERRSGVETNKLPREKLWQPHSTQCANNTQYADIESKLRESGSTEGPREKQR